MQKPELNIDFKSTTPITSPEGNRVFAQGVILQKVSKFLAGSDADQIIPIPCFYDIYTNKVLVELLPKELQKEFQNEEREISKAV
jgi:hypothetical protein